MSAVHRPSSRCSKPVTAFVAAFLACGLAACQPETSGPDVGVSVREIQKGREGDSDQFYAGRKVTVSADINRILGPHAFSIAGKSGVEPLLIVHPAKLGNLNEDSPVKVTGTVKSGFERANVEKALEFEFDRDVFSDYNGAPYIVAENVDKAL